MSESSLTHVTCPVVVLSIRGSSILGFENGEAIRNSLIRIVEQSGAENVVLEMGAIQYLQSAGFRPLLSLRRLIRERREGRVVLCHLQPDVEEVLEMSRMISADPTVASPFEAQPDVVSAVRAVTSG